MKRWKLVLVSEVMVPNARYVESTHRWKWQAEVARRRHRLFGVPTWHLDIERI